MQPRWNTRITITRTVAFNPRNDPQNGPQIPAQTNVYASLLQGGFSTSSAPSARSSTDTSQHPRTLRYATLRVLSNVDIRKNDQILDQNTGIHWIVDEVTDWDHNSPVNFGKRASLRAV